MRNRIIDEDFMIHILNNLPVEYDTVVEAMERKLDDLADPFTTQDLKNEPTLKYNRIKKNEVMIEETEVNENEETTLVGYNKILKEHAIIVVNSDIRNQIAQN